MSNESQARWYATKVVLILFSILASFAALMYINIMAAFILMAVGFVAMVAAALYAEAYDRKLVELLVKLNEKK